MVYSRTQLIVTYINQATSLNCFFGKVITKLNGRQGFHSVCTKILTTHKILEIIRNNLVLLYLNKGCSYTENIGAFFFKSFATWFHSIIIYSADVTVGKLIKGVGVHFYFVNWGILGIAYFTTTTRKPIAWLIDWIGLIGLIDWLIDWLIL